MTEDQAVWPAGAVRMYTLHGRWRCCRNWRCGKGLVVGFEFATVDDARRARW